MSNEVDPPPFAVVERVARDSYGRLLAHLATRWRDVAAAEDALAAAFTAALEHWPKEGIPASAEAWILTVARRQLLDGHRAIRLRARPEIEHALEAVFAPASASSDPLRIPDDRLRLMFVCAHPAIDVTVRPALMLQVVLGVEVARMTSAFLLPEGTLNKRLVRAKAKIRAAGLSFEEPEPSEMPARLHAVLEAIYAAYSLGRDGRASLDDADDARETLSGEALILARLVARLSPEDPEAQGFCALLELCEARRPAQVGPNDEFIPLLEQDPRRWDSALLASAHVRLAHASARKTPGPFQLEAAIAAAHCHRARSGSVPWPEIATLYDRLVARYPTVGAEVGRAIAWAHADAPSVGRALLEAIDPAFVKSYQPWWVALAHVQELTGERAAARASLTRALGLTVSPRLRRFLLAKIERLID